MRNGSPFQNEMAEQIWDMKYRLKEQDGTPIDDSVEDTWRRVAWSLAAPEKDQKYWADQFYSVLRAFSFIPAGRINAGAGTDRNVTLFNCFVMGTVPDSLAGICDMLKEAALTMQAGGGIGYDFSTVRPAGAPVKGVAAEASGPLTFMDVWDAMCRTIMSAGVRRGAMMATMRCDHPDVEKFVEAKRDPARLRMFNMSVLVTDPFMEAVKADASWDLVFDGRVYKTIKARALWNKIMGATYHYAEPGVIFIDRINDDNNLNYCETIAATNPCVTENTPILTKAGWVSIGQLVGKSVDVWNGQEWSTVTPEVTGENQKIITVNLSDGASLECTPAHKFVMSDGTKKQAKDLAVGDKLAKASWPIVEFDEWACMQCENPYAQGFFSGDGWQSGDRQYIGLYGDKVQLKDKLGGYISDREYDISGGYEGTDTSQKKTYLYYGRSNFFAEKSYVPQADTSVSERLSWLAGLIDADGCAVRDGNSVSVQSLPKTVTS
jgi:ribonucleotide reductase alpha subunit